MMGPCCSWTLCLALRQQPGSKSSQVGTAAAVIVSRQQGPAGCGRSCEGMEFRCTGGAMMWSEGAVSRRCLTSECAEALLAGWQV